MLSFYVVCANAPSFACHLFQCYAIKTYREAILWLHS